MFPEVAGVFAPPFGSSRSSRTFALLPAQSAPSAAQSASSAAQSAPSAAQSALSAAQSASSAAMSAPGAAQRASSAAQSASSVPTACGFGSGVLFERLSRRLFADTDAGLANALHHLTLLPFTPCMYMHGFTLVYIYIYIYKFVSHNRVSDKNYYPESIAFI